jgi:poly(A) polymerase
LLPRDPDMAEAIAARLRLSNKARKRLSCSAGAAIGSSPQALAYRLGVGCAVDRLLLAGRTHEAAAIASWHPRRLPISGGALIKRGLAQGPLVARTLRRIEDEWVEAGFPTGDAFDEIVSRALAKASAM